MHWEIVIHWEIVMHPAVGDASDRMPGSSQSVRSFGDLMGCAGESQVLQRVEANLLALLAVTETRAVSTDLKEGF
jgi:hypothetical protein